MHISHAFYYEVTNMKTAERHLEDILANKNTIDIIKSIRKGELDDYLPQLKDHKNLRIRRAIAQTGKYLDQYITDENPSMREAVIMQNSSYVPIMLENNNPEDDIALIYWMASDTKLDKDLWNVIMSRPGIIEKLNSYLPGGPYALKIVKQLWVKGEPDALSKTMTRTQLYQTNNPLWAYGYSVNQIDMFVNVNHTEESKYIDECFEGADNYYEWIPMSRN